MKDILELCPVRRFQLTRFPVVKLTDYIKPKNHVFICDEDV